MLLAGLKYDQGSLEESLARQAFERKQEIEFLKIMVMCNAIFSIGNSIISAVSQSEGGSSAGDALKKSIDALQKKLVPHWAEDTDKKAKMAREVLIKEVSRGPLKIKVLKQDRKNRRRRS